MRKKLSRISAVKRRGLIVFAQALESEGFIVLNDVGELAAIFALVIVEADQRRLHDIDAGHVLGNRETIGVLTREPLKVFDDVE
jgi:hypothetical protein